jgi:hypothetical protein
MKPFDSMYASPFFYLAVSGGIWGIVIYLCHTHPLLQGFMVGFPCGALVLFIVMVTVGDENERRRIELQNRKLGRGTKIAALILLCAFSAHAQAINPSVVAHVGRYVRTHKRLLVADAILGASWGADAASSTNCQRIAKASCVETNPLLGKHPSPAVTWGYAAGMASVMIAGEHLIWWEGNKVDPEAGHVIIWFVPVPFAISEFINVRTNVRIAERYRPPAIAPPYVSPCDPSHCVPTSSLEQARARVFK